MAQPTPPSSFVRGGPVMPSAAATSVNALPSLRHMRIGRAGLIREVEIEIAVVVDVEPAGADRGPRIGRSDADEDVRELSRRRCGTACCRRCDRSSRRRDRRRCRSRPSWSGAPSGSGIVRPMAAATSTNFLPPSLRRTTVSLSVGVEPPSRSMKPSPSKSPQLRPRSSWLPACGMPSWAPTLTSTPLSLRYSRTSPLPSDTARSRSPSLS